MRPVTRDLFLKFQPLSNIRLVDGKVYFVSTSADLKKNDYVQDLHILDPDTKEEKTVLSRKRVNYFPLKEGILFTDPDSKKEGYTSFLSLNGNKTAKAFELPLSVDDIRDFDEKDYLVLATVNRSCSNFHELSVKEQKAFFKKQKANNDYVILDEYPFCYNGAGVTNGNRSTLFLVDKETKEIRRVTSETMDVESYDVNGGKILYSGVDFTNFKGKWSCVYEYDAETKKTETLYDRKMQIQRVFYFRGKNVVMGTFAKEWGAMEASKFYELKNGKMKMLLDAEYTYYNAVLSDARYGRTRAFNKQGDEVYFATCERGKTIVLKYTGKAFERVVEVEGTVDDFTVDFNTDTIYSIAMIDQALEEVCVTKNRKTEVLTSVNKKVLNGRYVGKPEEFYLDKKDPVQGWVIKPIDYDPDKKYPAILDIHGGPKCAYGAIYMHEMQAWASEGYFVFFCNPRGSDGRGNAFADLRNGNYGKIDYEDIMDFTKEVLKRYPAIDKNRVGVTGGSYGGYMTNWIVGHTDFFKAAATQRSISNWITEVTVSDYGIDFPIEMQFKDVRHCEKELWDISPLKYVNKVKTPLLFIHSTEDYRCTLPEALQFYTPVKISGVDSKLVIFKGENHELSRNGKPLHRKKRLDEITDWMNKYLKED